MAQAALASVAAQIASGAAANAITGFRIVWAREMGPHKPVQVETPAARRSCLMGYSVGGAAWLWLKVRRRGRGASSPALVCHSAGNSVEKPVPLTLSFQCIVTIVLVLLLPLYQCTEKISVACFKRLSFHIRSNSARLAGPAARYHTTGSDGATPPHSKHSTST